MSCVCGEHDGFCSEETPLVGGPGPCASRNSHSYCGDKECLQIRREMLNIDSADDPRLPAIRKRIAAIKIKHASSHIPEQVTLATWVGRTGILWGEWLCLPGSGRKDNHKKRRLLNRFILDAGEYGTLDAMIWFADLIAHGPDGICKVHKETIDWKPPADE